LGSREFPTISGLAPATTSSAAKKKGPRHPGSGPVLWSQHGKT
jgi:hypothetical protein